MNYKLTSLIVDDSQSMRMALGYVLRDAGITVVEAIDGEDALAQAKKQQFDLVITDINMPKMNGLSLIKMLRTLPSYEFTPILTLTNLNSDRIKQEIKSAGASGWIQKPFGTETLLKTIQKVAA